MKKRISFFSFFLIMALFHYGQNPVADFIVAENFEDPPNARLIGINDSVCGASKTLLILYNSSVFDSLTIDFGDGSELYTMTTARLTFPLVEHNFYVESTIRLTSFKGAFPPEVKTQSINFYPPPNINIVSNTDSICYKMVANTIQFNALVNTISPSNAPIKYKWNFGDESRIDTTGNLSPTHNYIAPKPYLVTFSVSTNIGCTYIKNKNIKIVEDTSLISSIVATGKCPCNYFEFSASGSATNWHWKFGDGDESMLQNTKHLFRIPENYQVSLTASNSNNCSYTLTKAIAACQDQMIENGKSNNNWYFGGATYTSSVTPTNDGVGLNFTSSPPSALINSKMESLEAASTISDPITGNLLFYTNGEKVWNKYHSIMTNGLGLLGHPSSVQSMIIPNPANVNKYYIITSNGHTGNFQGYYYSEVDVSSNNDSGLVINKNILLFNDTCPNLKGNSAGLPEWEGIAATAKYRGDCTRPPEYWLVIPNCTGFNSYLISDTTTMLRNPVKSYSPSAATRYSLSFSPDGNFLFAEQGLERPFFIRIYDFNKQTGVIFNERIIQYSHGTSNVYAMAFSENSKVLYTCNIDTIFQFDLISSNIQNSKKVIAIRATGYQYAGMALASDGKIYVSSPEKSSLAVINNPNIVGNGCDFQENGISLNGKKAKYGLQNIASLNRILPNQLNLNVDVVVDSLNCSQKKVYASVINPECKFLQDSLIEFKWNFGDGTDTSILGIQSVQHTYSDTGKYLITLNAQKNCYQTKILTKEISIAPLPNDFLVSDTSLCEGDSLLIDFNFPQVNYMWSSGSTNKSIAIKQSGVYSLTITSLCETKKDTVKVNFNKLPAINTSNDTVNCDNQTVTLNDSSLNHSYEYLWCNGSTKNSYYVSNNGKCLVTVTNKLNGCYALKEFSFVNLCEKMYLPQSFSPNNDQINDYYEVKFYKLNPYNYNIRIYDRWGIPIFFAENLNFTWNGKFENTESPIGLYFITITNNETNKIDYVQKFTLIR